MDPLGTRRDFLKAGAGAAAWTAAAPLGAQEAPFLVDCQSHLYPPELLDLMETRARPPLVYRRGAERRVLVGGWHRKVLPGHSDVDAKVAAMDRAGIAQAAISANDPGPERFGEDGLRVARMQNDYLAEVSRSRPGRFFPLAMLPLQDMEASLRELDRCAERNGARGILLYSNLDGRFPDEPPFRPLFARAEAMGIPLLLHPAAPVTEAQTSGYEMVGGLGLMFDTTIALARIILSGLLERHPRLKLVCPHVGGALPYLIGRIDHQTSVLGRGAENLRKPPSEYLRQVYLDAVSPLPLQIRYGIDFLGADRMLYASDHPWVDPGLVADNVRSLRLGAADERKVFRENAARLFGL